MRPSLFAPAAFASRGRAPRTRARTCTTPAPCRPSGEGYAQNAVLTTESTRLVHEQAVLAHEQGMPGRENAVLVTASTRLVHEQAVLARERGMPGHENAVLVAEST